MIANYHEEGTKLAGWDSGTLAALPKENEEVIELKAVNQLMVSQANSVGSLSGIIKTLKSEKPDDNRNKIIDDAVNTAEQKLAQRGR